jgi:RNA polymerase sigma-70 factor (ECF subfamily)
VANKKGSFYIEEERLSRIVTGLRQKDKAAQEELEEILGDYVARYIRTKVGDERDVEELTADTLHTACEYIDNLQCPVALVRWVRTIAHSKIYHHYRDLERQKRKEERDAARKNKRRRFLDMDLSDPEIEKLVKQLPEKQKQVVMLRAEGLKVREIAEILQAPEGTVKSRLNYARKAVQGTIDAQNTLKSKG